MPEEKKKPELEEPKPPFRALRAKPGFEQDVAILDSNNNLIAEVFETVQRREGEKIKINPLVTADKIIRILNDYWEEGED